MAGTAIFHCFNSVNATSLCSIAVAPRCLATCAECVATEVMNCSIRYNTISSASPSKRNEPDGSTSFSKAWSRRCLVLAMGPPVALWACFHLSRVWFGGRAMMMMRVGGG
jgi:hypothetical protein